MIKTKRIFPDFETEVRVLDFNKTVILSCWLRVQDEKGVWYLNPHLERWEVQDIELYGEIEFSLLVKEFTLSIWAFQHLGKVSHDLVNQDGEEIFIKDHLQISEVDRMADMMRGYSTDDHFKDVDKIGNQKQLKG